YGAGLHGGDVGPAPAGARELRERGDADQGELVRSHASLRASAMHVVPTPAAVTRDRRDRTHESRRAGSRPREGGRCSAPRAREASSVSSVADRHTLARRSAARARAGEAAWFSQFFRFDVSIVTPETTWRIHDRAETALLIDGRDYYRAF